MAFFFNEVLILQNWTIEIYYIFIFNKESPIPQKHQFRSALKCNELILGECTILILPEHIEKLEVC